MAPLKEVAICYRAVMIDDGGKDALQKSALPQ